MTELANHPYRITSIDLMRGIVMVIMALDHTRDFFHIDAQLFQPNDLTQTTPVLFFTRWITHFCAPTFLFLSGISAGISLQRKSKKELAWFLFTRGLWLILLEVTVVRFGLMFNLYYDVTVFMVFWMIGASMIVLAALVFVPQKVVFGLGIFLIFTHDAFNFIRLTPENTGFTLWSLLQQVGFVAITPNHGIITAYPLLPWLGIMLAGYGAARMYTHMDTTKRKRTLLISGSVTIVLFILIRFLNVHAPLDSWSVQKDGLFTMMSFLNCTKTPVTLLFTLMTLGPVLIILAVTERSSGWVARKALVFGRVPLFYFIVHFYVLHVAAIVTYLIISGQSISDLDFHFSKGLGGIAPGVGYPLIWTYAAWILLIIVLYPVCRWYEAYKNSRKHWWLSYL